MPPSTVNLILGPAKSGKTQAALARFSAALDDWRRNPAEPVSMWIGPTPAALSDVRDRLASSSPGAWLNPRTVTFATLAQEIIAQGQRCVRPVCHVEKQRILAHVVGELVANNKLKHFHTVANTPGFLRQVGAAIADLKRRDVWPDEFRRRVGSPRDRDFAAIYTAYQAHLHAWQLYDIEGRFWAAREELAVSGEGRGAGSEKANPSRQGGEFQFGLIVIDGFADFTTAQHDLLRLLATHCAELLITLPANHAAPQRTPLFSKPRGTLELLEKSFPHVQRSNTGEAHFQSAGLAAVQRQLFADATPVADSATGLSIIAANGVQGEICEIARRIKRLLVTEEARPEDVAVVFPALEDVATRVEDIFDDYGLPLALDNRERLVATPLVRTLVKLLRLVVEDWPFDLILDVLGRPDIAIGSTGEIDRAALERCVRRAQLPAGRTLLLEQMRAWGATCTDDLPHDRKPDDRSSEQLRFALDAASALHVLERLDTALEPLQERAPLAAWIETLETLLRRLGLLSSAETPAWPTLKRQLALIAQIDEQFGVGTRQHAAADVMELVQRVSGETLLNASADGAGRIRVLAAESARNLHVKHLFLAGLSEQSYSSAETTGALYRESDLQRFTDTGPPLDTAEQQVGETMLLFYDMVTRPQASLTLSYAALDDRGQALTPSPYLTELERCFAPGAIPTTTMVAGATLDHEDEPLSRSEWRTLGMAGAIAGEPQWLAGLIAAPGAKQLGRAILHGLESVASRSDRDVFGPYEGLLLGDGARAAIARRYSTHHLWSASQLEIYATCPFKFFAHQILQLEPLEEIALRSDHLRRGNLLHQVLAAVHGQVPLPEGDLNDLMLVARFSEALQQLIAQTPLQGLEDALREIERREIDSWAAIYADQEIQYRKRWSSFDEPLVPRHFEVRFGPKARSGGTTSDPASVEVPFTIDLGTEQIKLTGQIDRIDMGRIGGVTVFNIIDYKSGKEVRLKEADIAAGRQLQLPLYALAAEKLLLADQGAVAFGAGYWSVKERGFASGRNSMLEFRSVCAGKLAESPQWASLGEAIKTRIAEIVHGVRSAHFPVYNEDDKCTARCEFGKICRIAHVRSLEKVWIVPAGEEPSNKA